MIAKLTGTIDDLKPTGIVLCVAGVGYELSIPFSTYEQIKGRCGVSLHVHTYHREDSLRLFGFYSAEEKNIFTMLIGISGVGPTMALSILSGITPGELLNAVRNENPAVLVKIPGIGKSKAEKLVFELKRKIKKLEDLVLEVTDAGSLRTDAVEALMSLGFDERKSSAAVDAVIANNPGISIESLVKTSLRQLSA